MRDRQITQPKAPDHVVAEVIALGATGHSTREIARITGIPDRTVADWVRSRELTQRYKEQAIDYAEQMLHGMRAKLSRLMDDRIDQALSGDKPFSDQQLAVNLGIITDKVQRSQPQHISADLTFRFVPYEPETIEYEDV